jgi:ketosteroid isomerase-like protein
VDVRGGQKFKEKDCVAVMKEQNKQFIKDWIEKKLQGQGDPLEDIEEDITMIIPGSGTNPIFGKHVGMEEFKKILGLLQNKVSQTFKVTDCIAEGNQVVALIEETLTRKDDPSKHYLNHTAWLFKLKDSQKIGYIYTYDNTVVSSKALE